MANRFDPVPFEEANLKVPLEPIPWPNDRAERVSVNSFGIGGANAHVSRMIIPMNLDSRANKNTR